jgi:hypothetical protein
MCRDLLLRLSLFWLSLFRLSGLTLTLMSDFSLTRVTSPYRQIFAVPGTTAFTLAALAARTAHLMTVLAIFFFIPFIPAQAGSYRLAGLLSAA